MPLLVFSAVITYAYACTGAGLLFLSENAGPTGRKRTVAIIINAIASNLSCVDPHVALQIWVVGLDAGVDDAHSSVAAAYGLSFPVTWGLHQVQVVQTVAVGCVGILHVHLVVQRSICHVCTTGKWNTLRQMLLGACLVGFMGKM